MFHIFTVATVHNQKTPADPRINLHTYHHPCFRCEQPLAHFIAVKPCIEHPFRAGAETLCHPHRNPLPCTHRDFPFDCFFRETLPATRSSACNNAAQASHCDVHSARCLAIQATAPLSGSPLNERKCSRPAFRRRTSRACSNTRICLDTAFNDIANGRAISVTRVSPVASRSRIARLVGSASAIKVLFRFECAAPINIQP